MNKNISSGVKKAIIFISLIIILLPATVLAVTVKANNSVYVAKNETIEGNLFAAGSTITVEGKINGDIYCVGQTINISGEIAGDVNCAGQTINITGPVAGSTRLAGNSIYINNKIGHNVMAAGATIVTSPSSTIGWDMLAAGATVEARGNVGRDLYGALANAVIAGQIGKNVNLIIGDQIKPAPQGININKTNGLTIAKTAKIGGFLNYKSYNEAAIEQGAVVTGKITHNLPTARPASQGFNYLGWVWFRLFVIFSAMVVGLVLISLWHDGVKKIIDLMINKIGPSIGWGVIAMILTPIIAILLMITVIGLPLSFILLALYFIALYLSLILVGILTGRLILIKLWPKQKDSLIWAMIIGIIITYLIYSIPFIGGFLSLVAMWWGLGGIVLNLKK